MYEIVLTAAQVAKLEDEIQTLYQVITFALPLIAAVAIATYAMIYRVQGAVKRNSKSIGQVANISNGTLTSMNSKIDAIHRRLDSGIPLEENNQHGTSESTDGTAGGTAGTSG